MAVRIKQLCAAPELQNRLRELGLGEEQIIKLLTSQTNFICQVCNARLAISQQLAQLILVEPLRPAFARWKRNLPTTSQRRLQLHLALLLPWLV